MHSINVHNIFLMQNQSKRTAFEPHAFESHPLLKIVDVWRCSQCRNRFRKQIKISNAPILAFLLGLEASPSPIISKCGGEKTCKTQGPLITSYTNITVVFCAILPLFIIRLSIRVCIVTGIHDSTWETELYITIFTGCCYHRMASHVLSSFSSHSKAVL